MGATSLLLSAANSAAAAPPPNDDRSNAIVLDDPLPVTVNGDSSEAVELDATDPVNPCTGTVLPYSLWYEYTPLAAGGVVLDWQPQTLDGVLTAYQVLRNGLLRFVDCAGAGDRLLPLQQGERHLFVVTSYPPEPMFGGSFTFSLRAAPPPVEVEDVHVIQATYNPRTAVARLLGSATCSDEAPNSAMLGRIRQVDRRTNQIIEET